MSTLFVAMLWLATPARADASTVPIAEAEPVAVEVAAEPADDELTADDIELDEDDVDEAIDLSVPDCSWCECGTCYVRCMRGEW